MNTRRPVIAAISLALAWSGAAHAGTITPSPNPRDLGNVLVGTLAPSTVTLTNAGTNTTIGSIVQDATCTTPDIGATASGGLPQTLGNGGTLTVIVSFTPQSRGARSCLFRVRDNGGVPATLATFTVTGTGIAPVSNVSPLLLTFPNTRVGSGSSPMTVTITNVGDTGTTLSLALSISSSDFFLTTDPSGSMLAAGQMANAVVTFNPVATGFRSTTLSITTNDPVNPLQQVSLSGVGTTAVIGVAPSSFDFGSVTAGLGASHNIAVSDTGTASLNVASATLVGSSWFVFNNTPPGSSSCTGQQICNFSNLTIPPSGSTNVAVRCAPPGGSTGMQVATLSFTSDAVGGSSTASLSCTAVNPDLSITKTDGQAMATPGTPITYTIVAANPGTVGVTGATLTDTLPAALTGATWTCVGAGGGSCTASGSGNIADSAVNLAVGATATYTLTATIDPAAAGSLANTASVSPPAGQVDLNSANDTATDTDTLLLGCDTPMVAVPDGRVTEALLPAGATRWIGATLRIGDSYSVEVESTTGATPPGALTLFSGDDGCGGTSTLATTDTSGLEPAGAAAGLRFSFTAAGTNPFFRARVVNAGPSVPFSFNWSDTTLFSPAWTTNGTFNTFYSFQNSTSADLAGKLVLLDTGGVSVGTFDITVPAGQTTSTNTAALAVARNRTGTARFTHNGTPGALLVEAAIANFTLNPAYTQPVKFLSVREAR